MEEPSFPSRPTRSRLGLKGVLPRLSAQSWTLSGHRQARGRSCRSTGNLRRNRCPPKRTSPRLPRTCRRPGASRPNLGGNDPSRQARRACQAVTIPGTETCLAGEGFRGPIGCTGPRCESGGLPGSELLHGLDLQNLKRKGILVLWRDRPDEAASQRCTRRPCRVQPGYEMPGTTRRNIWAHFIRRRGQSSGG